MVSERNGERSISLRLDGGEGCLAALSVVRINGRALPRFTVTTGPGDRVRAKRRGDDRIDYQVPASGRVTVTWQDRE